MDNYFLLKRKFDNKEKIIGTTMTMLNSSIILEKMAKRSDIDFILFDAEHGIFDAQNLVPLLQTMRLLKIPSFVRVQDAEYRLVAKVVDMGADGVMIPRTETLEQLKNAVDGLLFYPDGRKGMGGHCQIRDGEKFKDFAKTRFLLPQIESPKGIKNLPSMLEEYGEFISAIIIGPFDMSIMVGTPADIESNEVKENIKNVFDICKKYNKSCGIFCLNENLAKEYRSWGANVLWMGTDKDYYLRGLDMFLDGVKDL